MGNEGGGEKMKSIYMLLHGPDRSHWGIETATFPRLKDAKSAMDSLPLGRWFKIVAVDGGGWGKHEVREVVTLRRR